MSLADRKPSANKTKCSAELDTDGDKSTREYTYDSENKTWSGTYQENGYEVTEYVVLDLVTEVKGFELAATLLNKKVDNIFKFYATSKAYRITYSYEKKDDAVPFRTEGEYKYGEDGLQTYSREKIINLDAITSTETTINYSYTA